MSIWDDIKDLFKTKSEAADDEAQRAGAAIEGETTSGLVDALKQLEQQLESKNQSAEPDYDALFPKITLEKVEYTPSTDEQLQLKAESELSGDYAKEIQNLSDYTKNKGEQLAEYGQKLETDKAAALKETADAVASAKSSASDDMLKRGLGRSSIVSEILGGYDKAGIEKTADLVNTYNAKISDVEKEIGSLETEKQKSIADLDLDYAKKLSERIDELKEERLKLSNEAIEANNDIAKKQAQLDADRLKDIENYKSDSAKKAAEAAEKQATYEKKYGYSSEKQENYAKRYDLALRYYLTVDSDIALQAFESSANMKYYLGNYYDKLKSLLKERANNSDRYGIT